MDSFEGQLLVASPQIGDPRFHRAVILLLHHDDHGAMGVVLNRPIPKQAEAIAGLLQETLSGPLPTTDGCFHVGGPVAGPLIVLQGLPKKWQAGRLSTFEEDSDSAGRVFVVEEQDQLQRLIKNSNASLQFFVGHAGWEEGQLEKELLQGAWLTLPASIEFVFSENDDMWMAAMREFGRAFYEEVLGVYDFPEDVTLN